MLSPQCGHGQSTGKTCSMAVSALAPALVESSSTACFKASTTELVMVSIDMSSGGQFAPGIAFDIRSILDTSSWQKAGSVSQRPRKSCKVRDCALAVAPRPRAGMINDARRKAWPCMGSFRSSSGEPTRSGG